MADVAIRKCRLASGRRASVANGGRPFLESRRYIVADGAIGRAGGVSNKLTADISSLPCSYLLAPPPGCTGWFGGAGRIQPARGERSFLPRICKLNNKYADIREEAAFRLHAARATRGLVAPAAEGTAIFIRRLSGSRGPTLYTHTCTIPCCTCTRTFTLKRGGSVCARMHATRCTISLSRRLDAPLATLSRCLSRSPIANLSFSNETKRASILFPRVFPSASRIPPILLIRFTFYTLFHARRVPLFLSLSPLFLPFFILPCSLQFYQWIHQFYRRDFQPFLAHLISFAVSSFSTSSFSTSAVSSAVLVRVSLSASRRTGRSHTRAHTLVYAYAHLHRCLARASPAGSALLSLPVVPRTRRLPWLS